MTRRVPNIPQINPATGSIDPPAEPPVETEEPETEETDEHNYLDSEQVKQYIHVIDELPHAIVARLLLNGIPVKEIVKLRARDIKLFSNEIKLKKPQRKIAVDKATIHLITQLLGRERLRPKSTEKILSFQERNIRTFIHDYGKVAHIPFPVSPKTLQNTFFGIKMKLNPEWTIEDYQKHLGHSRKDYTSSLYRYYAQIFLSAPVEPTGATLNGKKRPRPPNV